MRAAAGGPELLVAVRAVWHALDCCLPRRNNRAFPANIDPPPPPPLLSPILIFIASAAPTKCRLNGLLSVASLEADAHRSLREIGVHVLSTQQAR